MKHYHLTLPECKRLNTYDQAQMIQALIDPITIGNTITFATEEEYLEWRRTKS